MTLLDRPAEPALETWISNSSGWGEPAPTKWALLDFLRRYSALEGQRKCMTDSTGRPVVLGRADGNATFARAVVCGKRSCPNCGPRIAIAHRDDIAQLVVRAKRAGWHAQFVTLTFRHTRKDSLDASLSMLLDLWKTVTAGGTWWRAKKNVGLQGMVRVLEVKYGLENGWHPHLHVLMFFRPLHGQDRENAAANFREIVVGEWIRQVRLAGHDATRRAQRMEAVRDEHLDVLAGYMAKDADIASEMTGGSFKDSSGHWTPLGLLRLANEGEAWAFDRYREFEEATKGRRLYASASSQLRAALAAAPAPDDAVEAAELVPIPRERLAVVSPANFRAIARVPGFRGDVAAVVEDAVDGWGVVDYLGRRGIASRVYEEPAASPAQPAVHDDAGAVDEFGLPLGFELPF